MVDVQNNGPPHWNVLCFPQDSLRQPVFSGPDGLADYRSHQLVDSRPVGTNPYTTEATYDTDYLWRAPPPLPIPRANGYLTPVHLRPRSSRAGEIGWHYYALSRRPDPAWTGHQILTSEFRRQLEDLNTHRYQNPWYPGEGEIADPTREGAYFRIFPHTGQRSRTSHDFRSKSGSSGSSRQYSSGPSGTPQSPHRRGRRTPAATAVTVCSDSGEVVSMEQSETEGDGRVGDEDTGGFGTHKGSSRAVGHNQSRNNHQNQNSRSAGIPGASQRRIVFRDQ